jgi:hypothetical protein
MPQDYFAIDAGATQSQVHFKISHPELVEGPDTPRLRSKSYRLKQISKPVILSLSKDQRPAALLDRKECTPMGADLRQAQDDREWVLGINGTIFFQAGACLVLRQAQDD